MIPVQLWRRGYWTISHGPWISRNGDLHGTWGQYFIHISWFHLVGCIETPTQHLGDSGGFVPSSPSNFPIRSWTNQVTSLLHQVVGINSRQMKSSLDMSPPTRWAWTRAVGLRTGGFSDVFETHGFPAWPWGPFVWEDSGRSNNLNVF